ncbi:MAG: hypothetical protein JWP12_3463 [Bacteroidetes bacterium]|nr:hypothetical protein [Bacteroidota bacterium]
MKRKYCIAFIFIFLQAIPYYCFAGDSIFSFKVSAGINYNVLRPHYDIRLANSYGHFNAETQSIKYSNDTTGFSPIIKVYIGVKLKKHLNFCFNFDYNYNKLAYAAYYSYFSIGYHTSPPYWSSSYTKDQVQHFEIISHNMTYSLGLEFHGKHLYAEPKFNLLHIVFVSAATDTTSIRTTDTRISYAPTSETTITHVKNHQSKVVAGGGLIVGYNFTIHSLSFFTELQADYYNRISYAYTQKGASANLINDSFSHNIQFASFSSSLSIGFKF